jgi:mono/diheme cytochrome c family protein
MNGTKCRVLLSAIPCNVAAWLTLAAATTFAQTGTATAERGAKLYSEKMCYTCHGYAGQGGERGSGPRLTPGLWPYPAFAQQLRHPRQDMPRYSSRFVSEDEVTDIYAYLASIKPGPAAKDIVPLRD